MPPNTSGGEDRLSRRKALIVQIVQPIPELPGYEERVSAYFAAARQHITRQEASLGPVARVFAEGVIEAGMDGMLGLRQVNPPLHQLVKSFVDAGAPLTPFEEPELLQEMIEWSQCLSTQPSSEKVHNLLREQYVAAAKARGAHIEAVLDASIGAGEVALIVASPGFTPMPSDVERYLISPPELDQLDRWMREQLAKAQQEMMQAAQAQTQPGENEGASRSQGATSGLWTPP